MDDIGTVSTPEKILSTTPRRTISQVSPAREIRRALFSTHYNVDESSEDDGASLLLTAMLGSADSASNSESSSNHQRKPRKPKDLKPSSQRPLESHPRHTPQTEYVQLDDALVPLDLWMEDEEEVGQSGGLRNYKFRNGKLLTQLDCIRSHTLRDKYNSYKFACERGGMIPCSRMLRSLGAERIDLSHQNLGDDNFRNILVSQVITEACKHLELNDNGLSDDAGFMLAEYLTPTIGSAVKVAGLQNLVALGLAGNRLGGDGGAALARALVFTPHLQNLNLKNNQIGDEVIVIIAESIKSWAQNTEVDGHAFDLRSIDLSYNELYDNGAFAISDIIVRNPLMSELSLTYNKITEYGLRNICDSFGRLPSLRVLRIAYNSVGTLGGLCIAEIIAKCPLLRYIDARENRIGTQAAVSMAEAVRMSRNLRAVRLDSNPFSSIGVNSLLSNLNAMPRVTIDVMTVVHCPEAEPETFTPRRVLDEQINDYVYSLNLNDPIEHCVAELLRVRANIAYGCTWVQPLIDREPLNLTRFHKLPRMGHVTFTLIPGSIGGQHSFRGGMSFDNNDDESAKSSIEETTPGERDPIPDEELIRERMEKIEELTLLVTFKKVDKYLRQLKSTLQDMFKASDMVQFDRSRFKENMDRYGCYTSAEEVNNIFRMVGWTKPNLDEHDVAGIEANDFDNILRAFRRDCLTLERCGVTDIKKFIRNTHVPMLDPPTVSLELSNPRDLKVFHIINNTDHLVTDYLCKTPWKNASLNGTPIDEPRNVIAGIAIARGSHAEFEWHDRTLYLAQRFVWDLSVQATRAEATKVLQAQILLADRKLILIRDFITKTSHNDHSELTKAESQELLKSYLVYDPDVKDRPPVVNLPSEGEMIYRTIPAKPVVLFAEEWRNMNLRDTAARSKIEEQLKRCFSSFGESIVHLYINNKVKWPIMTDRFKLPSSGTLGLTFVMLRPKVMLRSMKTYDYKFDLSNELERHKAMFMRAFIVHSRTPQSPLWRDTIWDDGSGQPPRDIHFIEVCTPDLWEIPSYGTLKCTFVDFQTNVPLKAKVFKCICRLCEQTTSECERVQVIAYIFQSDTEAKEKERARDPFWITAKMAKQLVSMFSTQAARDEAYDVMRSHVVDPQNAIDLEGTTIGMNTGSAGNDTDSYRRASTFIAAGNRQIIRGARMSVVLRQESTVKSTKIRSLQTMRLDARDKVASSAL